MEPQSPLVGLSITKLQHLDLVGEHDLKTLGKIKPVSQKPSEL